MSHAPLLAFDIDRRRALAAPGGPWHALATSLADDLTPMLSRDLLRVGKARLTRSGGRCAVDGVLLEFDPWSPHEHRCARCGAVYARPEDHAWWSMGAHLWSAERAVHAAALYLLHGESQHAQLAVRVLADAADRYAEWPNVDNVLGPSRPMFSTYLESIWLLNLCHAISLLGMAAIDAGTAHALDRVRDRVIAPSAALVASYHEGLSNRQVWNEVAILSAHRILGEQAAFHERVERRDGLLHLIDAGLLDDGTWYEGENYHLFAHRGLWYGVELLRAAGRALDGARADRFAAGFVAPFLGLLPDDTFPSRRDSQYRVSIHQWRIAEWCELGLTFRQDARLAHLRARLYADTGRPHDTHRSCSTADAERNTPPSSLSRADCSWRALLVADGDPLEDAPHWSPGSVVLPSQGLAVIRRDGGSVYVALEGGHTGGGHGHPDRLALTLQRGTDRFLDDPGTGSYVERALHWYRSTLAHAAPLVDGASQARVPAALVAWEDRGAAGWIVKRARIAPQVEVTRRVIVAEGYLVDVVEWESLDGIAHEITVPMCGNAEVHADAQWQATQVGGAGGLEDGFDFVEDAQGTALVGTLRLAVRAATGGIATLWMAASAPGELVRATVPGPPGEPRTQRHWIRARAARGTIVSCWSWLHDGATSVRHVELSPRDALVAGPEEFIPTAYVARVETRDGTAALHGPAAHGWHMEMLAGNARSSLDLEGVRAVASMVADAGPEQDRRDPPAVTLAQETTFTWQLGAAEYLRTEESWHEAGRPTATVTLVVEGDDLVLSVNAATGPVMVPAANDANLLDNERADVNADGVQLYFGAARGAPWQLAWLIVPSDPPRVTPLVPAMPDMLTVATTVTDTGWRLDARVPVHAIAADNGCVFDVVVNERPAHRARRRGQLVLSGGEGYAWLRGDRHASHGAVTLRFPGRDDVP